MTYFMVLAGIIALVGLATLAVATQGPLTFFGAALFVFGLGFAFFLVKRHFDAADAARH